MSETVKSTCALLLLLVLCTGPLAGDAAPRKRTSRAKERARSERMFVRREGDDLYVSAKMDGKRDIVYHFRRCMFNELYTFCRVGMTRNDDPRPTQHPEAGPEVVLNSTHSDNIGPFGVAGYNWCGGNHRFMERTARTAFNEGYAIAVDGRPVAGDTTAWAECVTVEAANIILDPRHPVRNADGAEALRDTLCREQVRYAIRGNNIEVEAAHRFCGEPPVDIAIYYGMQSMFEGETAFITPGGAYPDWTGVDRDATFLKRDYPHFRRFIERNDRAYQSTFLLPDGLGDHASLADDDIIFIYASYGKCYHKLIGNRRLHDGDSTLWRGVYTWFAEPLADDASLMAYEGIVDGRRALFIDTKRACERTLDLPAGFEIRHAERIDHYGDLRIEPAGRHAVRLASSQPSGCVLLLDR